MQVDLGNAINSISLSRDYNNVVAAGRSVFKVFRIEEDGFKELCDVRRGTRHVNLDIAATDVVWDPHDEETIVSSATNGSIVAWTIRQSRMQKNQTFEFHDRVVTKVCFHSQRELLLSGDRDGKMKLLDLRASSSGVVNYSGGRTRVHCVQFEPNGGNNFAAAFEDGIIEMWDMRQSSGYVRKFSAHKEPVFTLDWHPVHRWLATGGRDRCIKVWNIDASAASPSLEYSVQTVTAVPHVKWRPQRNYSISSCGRDRTINIWDLRRPYIPFATFDKHTDKSSCVLFRNDPHQLLSCGGDGLLILSDIKEAHRPADHFSPVCHSLSPSGEVALAVNESALNNKSAGTSSPGSRANRFPARWPGSKQDRADMFLTKATSQLLSVSQDFTFDMPWLVACALGYQLSGASLEELCLKNAQVAAKYNRHQVASVWTMLRIMYSKTTLAPGSNSSSLKGSELDSTGDSHVGYPSKNGLATSGSNVAAADSPRVSRSNSNHKHHPLSMFKESEMISSGADTEEEEEPEAPDPLTKLATSMSNDHGDFFFGEGETEYATYPAEPLGELSESSLEDEAFPILPDNHVPGLGQVQHQLTPREELMLSSPAESDSNPVPAAVTNVPSEFKLEVSSPAPAPWQPDAVVVQMLKFYAEKGDVQTAVSLLSVLGDRVKGIDEAVLESWTLDYLDVLQRFQLCTVANVVVKLSRCANVFSLNNTIMQSSCGLCHRTIPPGSVSCQRCRKIASICSLCHLPVYGLLAWCHACGHGGHYQHVHNWFSSNSLCAAGCGHRCVIAQPTS